MNVTNLAERTDDPTWGRIRRATLSAYSSFRDAPQVVPKVPPLPDLPLTGAAFGRLWEVRFHRPRFLSPDRIVGVTTGIRWGEPDQLRTKPTPWVYIGARPRAFSRASLELDRLLMRYKRAEGDMRGIPTGDPAFDRAWAVYSSGPEIGEVMRRPPNQQWLSQLAELRPRRKDDLPVIACLGGTAILSVVVDDSDRAVRVSSELPRTLGHFLDEVETAVGVRPASLVPLAMDSLPDETGYAVPTLRFTCAACGQETHARHQPNVDVDVCDRCGKSLYRVI